MKKEKKSNKCLAKKAKGITLIALVVTIVVLLILAGVSITVVFGDNGLLNYTKDFASETNSTIEQTMNKIGNLENELYDFMHPPEPPKNIAEAIEKNYVFEETTTLYDEAGNPIITIPGGFRILGDTDDNNVEYADPENPTVDDGIVIQDGKENEFVWVPVFDETPIYTTNNGQKVGQLYDFENSSKPEISAKKRAAFPTSGYREPDILSSYDDDAKYTTILDVDSIDTFKKQLQDEFNDLVESVNQYKGFYIGRYETGALSSEKKDSTPVVQKNKTPGNANWYYQYVESQNIAKSNKDTRIQKSVTSSMIWGCQWDAVMNWFLKDKDEDIKKYVTNSTGWYVDITEDDKETNSNHETGKDLIKDGKVVNRVKNIYDMGGNVTEWTLEAKDSSSRVLRGGRYDYSGSIGPASYRGYNYPSLSNTVYGSRSTLIVNP